MTPIPREPASRRAHTHQPLSDGAHLDRSIRVMLPRALSTSLASRRYYVAFCEQCAARYVNWRRACARERNAKPTRSGIWCLTQPSATWLMRRTARWRKNGRATAEDLRRWTQRNSEKSRVKVAAQRINMVRPTNGPATRRAWLAAKAARPTGDMKRNWRFSASPLFIFRRSQAQPRSISTVNGAATLPSVTRNSVS